MTTTAPTTNWHYGQLDVAGNRNARNGGGSRPSGLRERKAQRTRADLIDAA